MEIKVEKLEELVANADQIFISPEGEETLIQLLDLQSQVEQAIELAKKKLEESALKLNPNFKSIQADKVKVFYRQYGAKFKIDESQISQLPKDFYSTKVSYTPNVEKIEEFVQEKGGLPVGVIEPDRPKTLSFSLKKGGKDE